MEGGPRAGSGASQWGKSGFAGFSSRGGPGADGRRSTQSCSASRSDLYVLVERDRECAVFQFFNVFERDRMRERERECVCFHLFNVLFDKKEKRKLEI